jgi:hypothetical protein
MSPPKPNEPAEIMREVNAKAKFEAFERKLNERGGYLTWADTENHRKEFGGCRITSCGVTYDYGTHPLAALAMRERAAEDCDGYCYECATAIRALPTTFTDAELLAAAMADDLLNAITAENKFGDRSLTITGPTANLKLLMGAEDDALAAIAPFTKGAS